MVYNIGIYIFAFLVVLTYPSLKTVSVDFRNLPEPLVIKISPNNPSLAAFFDVELEVGDSELFSEEPPQLLIAGTNGLSPQNDYAQSQEEEISDDIRVLTGEEIRVSLSADLPAMYGTDGELLPLGERMRQMEGYFATQDQPLLLTQSWQKKAQELLFAANTQDITEVDQKLIPTKHAGSPILVKRVEESPEGSALPGGLPGRPSPSSRVESETGKESGQKVGQKVGQKTGQSLSEQSPNEPEVVQNNKEKTAYVISGEIELGGGLAHLMGESHLIVYREENGQIKDEGKIWFDQGRYEIVVQDIAGYLIVELQNKEGKVLGLSEQDLYGWDRTPYAHNKIEGVHFMIEPVQRGIDIEVSSARSAPGIQAIKNAWVNIEGLGRLLSLKGSRYMDPFIEEGSTFWVKSSLNNNWATHFPVHSQGSSALRMFPKLYLQTVATSIEEKFDETKGWIAGRVGGMQKPIAGAKIEIVGIDSEHKAIYFTDSTELIQWPDKAIPFTSTNGMFIVPNLSPGAYSVRVVIGDKILPAESLYVESQSVTYLDLEYGTTRVAGLNLYDPIFNLDRLGATLRVFGSEREFQIFGTEGDRLSFPEGRGTLTLEVDAGREYLVSKTQFSRNSRALRVPMVPEKWFYESLIKKGQSQFTELGTVVGFIDGDEYDVIITGGDKESEADELEIIYFNSSGEIVEAEHGVKGGGFIIPNLPEGLVGISVVPHNKKKVLLKSVVSERGFVTTFAATLN